MLNKNYYLKKIETYLSSPKSILIIIISIVFIISFGYIFFQINCFDSKHRIIYFTVLLFMYLSAYFISIYLIIKFHHYSIKHRNKIKFKSEMRNLEIEKLKKTKINKKEAEVE